MIVTFSKRQGFASSPPVQFRQDAPTGLRYAVIQAAYDYLSYDQIRTSICRTLHVAPDRGNWSEVPNIRDEVHRLVDDGDWYRVYDIVEGLVTSIDKTCGYRDVVKFAAKINDIFVDLGAGWQLLPGKGIIRGATLILRTPCRAHRRRSMNPVSTLHSKKRKGICRAVQILTQLEPSITRLAL